MIYLDHLSSVSLLPFHNVAYLDLNQDCVFVNVFLLHLEASIDVDDLEVCFLFEVMGLHSNYIFFIFIDCNDVKITFWASIWYFWFI